MHRKAMLVACLLLCACGEGRSFGDVAGDTLTGTAEDAVGTLRMPFEDLNLVSAPIPPPLETLGNNPYLPPLSPFCDTIPAELKALDETLGPDMDSAPPPLLLQDGAYVEKGAQIARQSAVSLVRSQVNIMPFRGVARRLTGAERNAKALELAYEAGKLRRAYLKGLLKAYDCVPHKLILLSE